MAQYWEAGAAKKLEQTFQAAQTEAEALEKERTEFDDELTVEVARFQAKLKNIEKRGRGFEDACFKLEEKLDNCADDLNKIQDENLKKRLREARKEILRRTDSMCSRDNVRKKNLKELLNCIQMQFGDKIEAVGNMPLKEDAEKHSHSSYGRSPREERKSNPAAAPAAREGSNGHGFYDRNFTSPAGHASQQQAGGSYGSNNPMIHSASTESSADLNIQKANRYIDDLRTLGHEARTTRSDAVESNLVDLCDKFCEFLKLGIEQERSASCRNTPFAGLGSSGGGRSGSGGLGSVSFGNTINQFGNQFVSGVNDLFGKKSKDQSLQNLVVMKKNDWMPALQHVDGSIDRLRQRVKDIEDQAARYGNTHQLDQEKRSLEHTINHRQNLLSDVAKVCNQLGITN